MEGVGELRPHGVELEAERQRPRQDLVRRADRARARAVRSSAGSPGRTGGWCRPRRPTARCAAAAARREDVQDAAAAAEQTRADRRAATARSPARATRAASSAGGMIWPRRTTRWLSRNACGSSTRSIAARTDATTSGRSCVRVQAGQALERAQALGELVGVVGQAVVRQRVGLGKQQDRRRGRRPTRAALGVGRAPRTAGRRRAGSGRSSCACSAASANGARRRDRGQHGSAAGEVARRRCWKAGAC